jgi:hypothetical protein
VIILQLLPELTTNDVAGIPGLPLISIPQDQAQDPSLVIKRQEFLASTFRHLMTYSKDPKFESLNDYRKGFYTKVIELASKVNFRVLDHF